MAITAGLVAAVAGACGWGRMERDGAPARWGRSVQRAIEEVRADDPDGADRLEGLLVAAARDEAAARGSWRAGPRRRAAGSWHRAVTEASRRVREVRTDRAARRLVVEALVVSAEDEVERAEGRAGFGGGGRLAGSDLAGAELAAEDAIALADAAQATWRRQHDRLADPALRALWERHVAETIGQSRRSGRTAVVVDKGRRRLTVYRAGEPRAEYPVELGTRGLAPKLHEGDLATPEGRYRVVAVKTGAATRYHAALLLDYPNADDRRRYESASRAGTIPAEVGIGGLIEIHGSGGRGRDWTEGCVALADGDVDALLGWVEVGTPVTIVGTVEAR